MKFLACAALIGGIAMASAAQASDGTINFTGSVTGNTCTVTNDPVALPPVAKSNLNADGQVTGQTPFAIKLTGCTDGALAKAQLTGAVKAYFEPGTTVDLATGRLKVSGGTTTATNVQLQLLNSNGTVIKIGDPSTITGATLASGAATLNYAVRYYATGAATAGTANSSVTYSIVYQ
ncbi:type 1 fimbrial protein [Dyella marensis]|uniref:fimbrial protein n=1 Tax=Dyella marensis TaxID=500610 RepID=UPI0031E0DEED